MLQIGLTGLMTYVKASSRSPVIDELLLSKDYISEIISMAADHFSQVKSTKKNQTNSNETFLRRRSFRQLVFTNVC